MARTAKSGKGRVWPAEWSERVDPISKTRVRQLTNYRCHSHHVYFTNSGWYDGGRKLLLSSDRENRTNLYSLDMSDGTLTQLTDLWPNDATRKVDLLSVAINPHRPEAYFCYDGSIIAIDLRTLEQRPIYRLPEKFMLSMLNCTADGKHICASIYENLWKQHPSAAGMLEARPLSRVIVVDTSGAGHDIAHEERIWISHVNTSPTQPHLLTFCHEGPWEKVDNRIWAMDLQQRKVWKLRPREVERERIGHEYWLGDGVRIGYHGSRPNGETLLGLVRFDGTQRVESHFSKQVGHVHSNDGELVVGDGGSVMRLWKWNGKEFEGPRVLCQHDCSMHMEELHVHPRFTADGKSVLCTQAT